MGPQGTAGIRGFTPAQKGQFNKVMQGLVVRAQSAAAVGTLRVSVDSGVFMQGGVLHDVYEHAYAFALEAADATNPRKDLVQVSKYTRQFVMSVKTGTAAAVPTPPAADFGSIPIAVVTVIANGTTLRYWDIDNSIRPAV